MAMKTFLLLFCLITRIIGDISRQTEGDIVNNKDCSSSDSCKRLGGSCLDRGRCQCLQDRSTYISHVQQCVPNKSLMGTLFTDRGCSFRLVANGYSDNKPRGRNPCVFQDLSLFAIDPLVSGSQQIDICGIFTWGVESCTVVSGAYYDDGKWLDMWNGGSSQSVFSIVKIMAVTMQLKWGDTLASRYHGNIISLRVLCNRKFLRPQIQSCLVFKVMKTEKASQPTNKTISTAAPTNHTAIPTTNTENIVNTVIPRHTTGIPTTRTQAFVQTVIPVNASGSPNTEKPQTYPLSNETDQMTRSPTERNYTGIPVTEMTQVSLLKNPKAKRDMTIIVIIGAVAGLFVLLVILLALFCMKKRRKLVLSKSKNSKNNENDARTAMATSPLYDMRVMNQNDTPVYSVPDETASGYQDLLSTRNQYESLVANKSNTLDPSPIYQVLEEPGDGCNDVTSHDYQVLEEPS